MWHTVALDEGFMIYLNRMLTFHGSERTKRHRRFGKEIYVKLIGTFQQRFAIIDGAEVKLLKIVTPPLLEPVLKHCESTPCSQSKSEVLDSRLQEALQIHT